MTLPPSNLIHASGDGDSVVTLIFVVVGLIVWGITALTKAAKGANNQIISRPPTPPIQRPATGPALIDVAPTANRDPRAVAQAMANALREQIQWQMAAANRASPPPPPMQRFMPPVPPPLPPVVPRPAPARYKPAPPPEAVVKATNASSPASPYAKLFRKRSLRTQVVITEILRPPIALRDKT